MAAADWAVVVPMANEERDFDPFIAALTAVLDDMATGTVYIVVDRASRDRTLELSRALSARDHRFRTVWAPDNRSLVDAYLRGYREAYHHGHRYIIEMDAGLSHDPRDLPTFLALLQQGYPCVYGSRVIPGGSMSESSLWRRFLSRGGTLLANVLLGTRQSDMTSGYLGFHAEVVGRLIAHPLRSTAHFYQTEVRYLLRHHPAVEIPIHYRAPSPRVSIRAIINSLAVLLHYTGRRIAGRPASIR
jgi:dolichol-phosphate mannosyltransferase